MIDNTLSLHTIANAQINNALQNAKSLEFKNEFKAQKELVNGVDTKALKEQTDAFESFFVKMLLDIVLKKENTLFPKDAADEIYGSMYNDTMSKALSGGFGFSQLMYDFLLERTK